MPTRERGRIFHPQAGECAGGLCSGLNLRMGLQTAMFEESRRSLRGIRVCVGSADRSQQLGSDRIREAEADWGRNDSPAAPAVAAHLKLHRGSRSRRDVHTRGRRALHLPSSPGWLQLRLDRSESAERMHRRSWTSAVRARRCDAACRCVSGDCSSASWTTDVSPDWNMRATDDARTTGRLVAGRTEVTRQRTQIFTGPGACSHWRMRVEWAPRIAPPRIASRPLRSLL